MFKLIKEVIKMNKSYKFRIYLNKEQEVLINKPLDALDLFIIKCLKKE